MHMYMHAHACTSTHMYIHTHVHTQLVKGKHCGIFSFLHSELLCGTVSRLESDAKTICSELKDLDDEEMVQRLFCFVLAETENEGFKRTQIVDCETRVMKLFSGPESNTILLLHTREQEHNLEDAKTDAKTCPISHDHCSIAFQPEILAITTPVSGADCHKEPGM